MMNDESRLVTSILRGRQQQDADGAVSWARRTEGDDESTERNRKNGGEKQDKQVKRKK
jgi:hypothetical protein